MPGFINNGLNELNFFTDGMLVNADTNFPAGENPESGSISLLRLAVALNKLASSLDKTTVAGTVYYRKFTISQAVQLTGVEYLIGSVGGTDKVMACVFDANGVAVAQSDSTGVTVGTAATWQQLSFKPGGAGTATPVTLQPGVYYIGIQSNGTTAKLATFNGPGLTLVTGSKAGAFGTIGNITPPATTYTANLGPVSEFYQ